jgi:type I restriction enzyme S subunit
MTDGLTEKDRSGLRAVLEASPKVRRVLLFGSRAMGTFRGASDVDLALEGEDLRLTDLAAIKAKIAELNLPVEVDLVVRAKIKNPQLEEHIKTHGHEWYRQGGFSRSDLAVDSAIEDVENLIREGTLLINDGYRAKNSELSQTGLPFARAGNIDDGFHFADADRVPSETLARVGLKRSQPGDVVFTSKGTVGRFAFVRESVPEFVYSPQLCYWRSCDPSRIEPLWLFYWMQSREFFQQYKRVAGQTDMAEYVSLRDQRAMRITLPPLAEQKAIAAMLGALDDKIELNRRMNATLEAMARALFQSWFVDFDPVRAKLDGRRPFGMDPTTAAFFPSHFEEAEYGKLPAGWRRAAIEEVCAINSWTLSRNHDFEGIEYVEISEVSRGDIAKIAIYRRGEEPSRARRRLSHGDTVLSTVRPDRGSYFLALNPPENRVASTGFAVLTPTIVPWSFLHAALTQPEVSDHLGQMADGGAYPAVRPEIIGAMQVALPNEPKVLEAFHLACAPLFEQSEANRSQSRTLGTLRDALLPQFLSGRLQINNQTDQCND